MRSASLFLAAVLSSGTAHAAADTPSFHFTGPEVAKLDWNTRALVARDLDGDGRIDLAVLNNDRSSIELLYQRDPAAPSDAPRAGAPSTPRNRWEPVLEDARFRKESIIVGQNLFDLVVADFNGDGRPDLATTGEPVPLLVRYAQEDGTWEEKNYATAPLPMKFLGALATADLDGDGAADLVILGQKEIAVFLQKPGAGLVLDEKIPLADDNAYGLSLEDLDGDGRVDLLHLASGQREALRVRHQVAPGKFGPELAFTLKTPRSPLLRLKTSAALSSLPPARRAGAAGKGGARKAAAVSATNAAAGPLFASAVGGAGQVEFSRLVPARTDDPWRGLAPRAFAPLAGARGAALYAAADFDGDGASDLAVAYAETAQVFLYPRQPDGGFTLSRRISSLTDARALASVRWTPGAPAELLVLSGKENALAAITFKADGSATPPRSLPVPGRLVTFAASDDLGALPAAAPAPVTTPRPGFAVVAEEDGKRQLALWTRDAAGVLVRGASVVLAGLRTDPRAVFLHDLDQDGRADLLVAIPSVGLRVYLQKDDGGLTDAADNPLYRPGLLSRAEAANAPFVAGDVDGDGRAELIVAAENFIRAVRVESSGELVTVAQFETRDPGAEITTGFVLPSADAAEPIRAILHDRKGNQLHLLTRAGGPGATETTDIRPVARLDVTGALTLTGPKGRRELLLLGKDRFWWMPEGAADYVLKGEGTYTSDLPEVRYFFVSSGDLDADGNTDLFAVDINSNTLELLSRDAEGVWASRMHFKVFETDPHFQGGRGNNQEPREVVVADVTGDGREDLVLLVHDRVLVYPQQQDK